MTYIQDDEHLEGWLISTRVVQAVATLEEEEGMLCVGPDDFFDETGGEVF